MRVLRCMVTGKSITLTQEMANSGEGMIWETSRPDWVAKLYHQPTPARLKKLEIMIAHPPMDPMRDRHHITFAWPQDILEDERGNPVGFVMPLIGESVPLSTIYNPRLRSRKAPRFNWKYLHTTALNIALAVQALHREGYVIGDIKPQNILVNKNALISIIDTDSFQVKDPYSQSVYRCLVGSEGFTPPELLGQELSKVDQTEIHDRFRLAVIIYLLLFGDHPFKGRWIAQGESPNPTDLIRHGYWPYAQRSLIKPGPTTIPLDIAHSQIQSHFQDCFTLGHRQPNQRPRAEDWAQALRLAIKSLKACHLEKNHLFSTSYGRCYWCDRKAKLGLDIFSPDLKQKLDRAKQAKSAPPPAPVPPPPRRGSQPGSIPVSSGGRPVQSDWGSILAGIKQRLTQLPPTVVGSVLCLSSLFGLGLLLVPELYAGSVQTVPDSLETLLRSWFQLQPETSSAQNHLVDPPRPLTRDSHNDAVTQVDISPDGQFLVSGSRDMTVKVWDLRQGRLLKSLTEHYEPINFVRFTPDGRALMSSSRSGDVVFWTFPQGTLLRKLDKSSETGGGALQNATTDAQGNFLVSNGWSGGIMIHNLLTNQLMRIETNTYASEQALVAMPSHAELVSSSSSGQMNVWSLKTGESLRTFPDIGEWQSVEPVRVMAVSPEGSWLASGNWSGTINLWDYPSGKIMQSLIGHRNTYISAITFSEDGQLLATGGGDHLIKLWNLRQGRLVKTFRGHRDDITSLDFSSNGQTLVSGGQDHLIKVWDIPSGQEVKTLAGQEDLASP
ncbi:protein kinase domain-containing protein [Lyngbya confervoides]|uniref:Protein kinase domain-containing protein n=1 Tax=Lyngbya confervoides BDU141951 TaxID=1574623 RepID=A0ABD4T773_9CYAN|nr:hypothetical protein [Lyngbya confervoides]MCM1984579.1 hypothetical protein [Lyngbya confervoides BDU141951]